MYKKKILHSFISNAALQVVDLIQGGGAVKVGMEVVELKSLKRSGKSVRSDNSMGRKIRRTTKALEDIEVDPEIQMIISDRSCCSHNLDEGYIEHRSTNSFLYERGHKIRRRKQYQGQ